MKLKKVLLSALSLALVAAVSIGGTLAYLTGEDSDVNVMTMGNVKIAQHEYERATNEDGTYKTDTIDNQTSYVLEAFKQGKVLLPIVGDPSLPGNSAEYAGYDAIPVRMSQVDSYGGMDVFAGKNAQDKFVTVENTGKTDAYVRTLVAIEVGTASPELIGISYHKTWTVNNIGVVEIDGNKYFIKEFVYNGAQLSDGSWRHENGILPAEDTSYPSLSQVYIKSAATNEDCEKLDGNGNGTLDIIVISQAVQAAGFSDAQTALDTAFGTSAAKAAEWFGGVKMLQYAEAVGEKDQVLGEDAEKILDALENGDDLLVDEDMDILAFNTNNVDAQGATATLNGVGPDAYGYLSFRPDAGEDVTVSNLNVTGSGFVEVGHVGMGGGNYTVNNLKIKDLASTLANSDKGFTLSCAFMHFGTATLNDCVMTGATTIRDGATPVDLGCGNNTTTVINGGEYGTVYCWSNSVVTINGAEVDTLWVAPNQGSVTVKAGTSVKTINIAYGNIDAYVAQKHLVKLVIEDGANVGAIVFRGNTYTVDAWNAFVANFK